MVLLETALLFLGVVLIAGGCGFGIVSLLLPDEYRDEFAFVLMPVVGYCFYSWVAFNLSGTFQIPGHDLTVSTAAVMALLGLLGFLLRPPTRAMVKRMWPTLPLCLAGVCLTLWPLFVVGADTYLGAVNPDYTATLFDIHFLQDHALRAEPLSKKMFSYSYFNNVLGGIGTSARFGSAYFVLLVKTLLALPYRTALTLCIGFFIFSLSLSVYFMARAAFGLSRRAALIAAPLVVMLMPVAMSYVYFYVGQNSGMGVLPAVLTVVYLTVTRPSARLVLLATLLLVGLYIMYTAMVPYAMAPVGAAALYLLLRGRLRWRRTLAVGLSIAASSLILNVGNLQFLRAALKGWNRLVTQSLQGQFFIDFLTEQFIPIFLGLASYPMNASLYAPLLGVKGRLAIFAVSVLIVLTLFAAALHWARTRGDDGSVALGLAAFAIYFVVWYVYTFRRPYGYALFKMCSWLQFMYVMPLAYALDQAPIWAQRWTGPRRWMARGAFTVAAFAVAANAVSTVHMTRLSLGRDTEHGLIVNLYQMSGNYDYLELADCLREWVKPSESVGLSFVDSIQNEWVSYYLRDYRTSLLGHYVIPADDENLPGIIFRWVTDYYGNANLDFNYYFHGATDNYYLTWSDRHLNRDIVDRRLPPPLWENGTFRLQRAADCPGFIYTGRGWYRLEFRHYWEFWWPDRFRWTAEGGEIYMLRGRAGAPYRLSFYGHVGHGLKSESRTAELWHNTQKFDEVTVTGAGRVVSKPFYSSGGVDLLVIKLKEKVRPLPRSFRLWNKQIPGDYRRLNLMVADVRVFPPEEPVPEPSTYSLHGDDLFEQSYAFDGLQPNRWAGRSLSMTLKRPPWARGLTLSVFVPGISSFHFPYTLQATIDGKPHPLVVPRPGPFRTTLPLGPPRADGLVELRAASSQSYVPDRIDMEMHPVYYSYRVEYVGLVP